MLKNEAAWMVAKSELLEVKEAPYVEPRAGEILVRNHAVAVNPVDWMQPVFGNRVFPWIKRPFILGSDLSGDVVAVGSGVTSVRVGDRVLALAAGACKQRNRAAEGAFQNYTITLPNLTTIIPDGLPYPEAAVIPLGLTTAACGLFQKDLLALELPMMSAKPRSHWVIIGGGATSVGCNAIQLATAAGYSVVSTASPKNFDYLKSLGAIHVFDYKDNRLVRTMADVLRDKDVVGALAIGAGSAAYCIDVLEQCRGRKFVANCSSPIPHDVVGKTKRISIAGMLRVLPALLGTTAKIWWKSRRTEVVAKFYDASSMVDNETGRYMFQEYLGKALANGSFVPAPPPNVVGTGLSSIQMGFDVHKHGVSASKIVVALN
jgi:NADPH:quinone reductase-like Zn-dependent oxidoreductase